MVNTPMKTKLVKSIFSTQKKSFHFLIKVADFLMQKNGHILKYEEVILGPEKI